MNIRISDTNTITYMGQMTAKPVPKTNNSSFAAAFTEADNALTKDALIKGYYKYKDYFDEAAAVNDVPVKLLVSVAFAESNFDAMATGYTGSKGIMQLMPDTVNEMDVVDPYDARESIDAGAQLLARYLDKYNGSLSLALSAYNAGPGSVERYNGVPPFAETTNYIKKIKNAMNLI